jgi:hypothetical protein
MPKNKTEAQARGEILVRENPAIRKPNWLPEGLWPELDELRERHVQLLADSSSTGSRKDQLTKKYEREDEAQMQALQAGEDPPPSTPMDQRQSELHDAKLAADAAHIAFCEAVSEMVAKVREKRRDWNNTFTRLETEAREKREEMARLQKEAEQKEWDANRLRLWLSRTAEDKPGRHVAFEQVSGPVPVTDSSSQDTNIQRLPDEHDEVERLAEKAEQEGLTPEQAEQRRVGPYDRHPMANDGEIL